MAFVYTNYGNFLNKKNATSLKKKSQVIVPLVT